MSKGIDLIGRGVRYIRKYGVRTLYCKVMERRLQNKLERPYSRWVEEVSPSEAELEAQRQHVFAYAPKISVLVPTYETPREFLCQMVDTLCAQSYSNWELCIADGSRSDLVKETLKPYLERDDRIKYEKLSDNLGISENTNAALRMATGEWIGLLDHDDILYPNTLYEICAAMEAHGEAEAFYTDEDKISFDLTTRFQPHFKPEFNREYLRSNNYICHFFVVKRAIAHQVGGFSTAFDGAQDHDFILKCTEIAKEVCHIPKILYSWRCHASSTAANPESKLYAYESGKRAVEAHLARAGEKAQVLHTTNYGFYRVKYDCAEHTAAELHGKFINSFADFHGQSGVNVVYYDRACNNIVTFVKKDVTDDYVLFTRVKKFKKVKGEVFAREFLDELRAVCDRPGVGLVCARVYDKTGRMANDVRMAGVSDPFYRGTKGLKEGYLGYFHRACLQQEIEAPTDCFLVRGDVLKQVLETIPEKDGKITLEVDRFAQIVRGLGLATVYDPWAVLYER